MQADKGTIINLLESYAPLKYAMSEDNPGIQTGDLKGDVTKCLITLDVDEQVIDLAISEGVDLIISHHPLIFSPLKNLSQYNLSPVLQSALKNNITIYTSHTNLDMAPRIGVNHALLNTLELPLKNDLDVLLPVYQENYYKSVVFVPKEQLSTVRDRLAHQGAGFFGNYSHCTFYTSGIGTFMPLEGSDPYIGKQGKLQEVEEARLESIVFEDRIDQAISAIHESHPYEEPAYELQALDRPSRSIGLGLVGNLSSNMSPDVLVHQIEEKLDTTVRLAGFKPSQISRIALCSGSGGKLVEKASSKGADALITGDVKYHEALEAEEQGLFLIDAGHMETELPAIKFLAEYFTNNIGCNYSTEFIPYMSKKSVFYR